MEMPKDFKAPPKSPYTTEEIKKIYAKVTNKELHPNSEEFKLFVAKIHEYSPLSFAKAFLKDHLKDQATNELIVTPPFHRELEDMFMHKSINRIAVAAPRGHAKSTVTSFFYVLHQALYNRRQNIVIISTTEDMAKRFLRRIRDELELNPMLTWLFGPQRTDKWSETELRLNNRVVIHAKGRGAQLRGLIDGTRRPDLIVLDDIEDEELCRSELRRLDLEQWFNGTVLPALEPKIGKLVVIGTILHQDSLLSRLLNPKLYPDFITRKYQAVDPDTNESLWPERFSKDSLQQLKESYMSRDQLAQFYMEYMNDPIPEESAVFRPEYFHYFESLPQDPKERIFVEMFVDLGGGGQSKTADPTAMTALAVDKHNNVYIHDYVNKRYGSDTKDFMDDFFQMISKYGIRRVVIEKTSAALVLKNLIEDEMRKRSVYVDIEYVTPPKGSGDRRGNMSDAKYQRIAALAGPMKMGTIKMRTWMKEMQEQLLAFPRARHDDLADTLAYGWQHIRRRYLNPSDSDPILGRKQEPEYVPLYDDIGI